MLHRSLWEANQDLAQACLDQPFVRSLSDGSLPAETFRAYIAQDAFFLEAFARAYALALARSNGVELIEIFERLIAGVRGELRLHKSYSGELGIDLSAVEPSPACRAYTDFLLATAWIRPLGEILAAMTPCMRLYAYLGEQLCRENGGRPRTGTHPYRRWIATYSDPEFQQLADHVDGLLDRFAEDTKEVRQAYRYAMKCELDFFDDAFAAAGVSAGGRG